MSRLGRSCLVALVAAGTVVLALSEAQAARQRRQYYSPKWSYNKKANYHYKTYQYKAKPADTRYRQQVVVYKPARAKTWVYWYNPETEKYWARCPTVHHPKYGADVKRGKDMWSMLPERKKHANLDMIKDGDFGKLRYTSP